MAITPSDARSKAMPDEKRLQELQVYIDECLVKMTATGYWHGIDVENFTYMECKLLLHMYREKGWTINGYSDQREGRTYWNFRARKDADR